MHSCSWWSFECATKLHNVKINQHHIAHTHTHSHSHEYTVGMLLILWEPKRLWCVRVGSAFSLKKPRFNSEKQVLSFYSHIKTILFRWIAGVPLLLQETHTHNFINKWNIKVMKMRVFFKPTSIFTSRKYYTCQYVRTYI